jgi:hypothetical protein
MARKPRVSDATGWTETYKSEKEYGNVIVEEPTGLTVTDSETRTQKRFSYVSADMVLRNWFRLRAEGHKTKYFYGETAWSDVAREASDLDWEIMAEKNGWN